LSLSWARPIQSTLPPPISTKFILMLSTHLHLCLPSGIFPSQNKLDLQNTTLRHSFHFQHRNPRMLPIESFVHDSRSTLVCPEYSYLKGSPPTVKEEIHHYSSQDSAHLSAHPNDLVANLMVQPNNRQLQRHLQTNCLPDPLCNCRIF
jgi:hypothetical protein